GLGISFSFQPNGDHSTVNVQGQRLTSSAGNFDNGLGFNGALVTVGGVGDTPFNPPDPFHATNTRDHELYDLAPLLHNRDTQIVRETASPGNNESVFRAVMTLSGTVGVAPLFTDLGTVGQDTEIDLTLTQGDEDWFKITAATPGDLVAKVTLQPGGTATALM